MAEKTSGVPERSLTTLATGYYRLISLKRSDEVINRDTTERKLIKVLQWGRRAIGKSHITDGDIELGEVIKQAVEDRMVEVGTISRFPSDLSSKKDRFFLGRILPAIKSQWTDAGTTSAPGLALSDFLEVLPIEVAARVASAAADPDIGQSIFEQTHGRYDSQIDCIAAVVLLPRAKRRELLVEMMKLDPSPTGRGYSLFRLITSDWANAMSKFNAVKLIYANLQDEAAADKIEEVSDEFMELGNTLRAMIPAKPGEPRRL